MAPAECGRWLRVRLSVWLRRGLLRLSTTPLNCLRLLLGLAGCIWLSRLRSSCGFLGS